MYKRPSIYISLLTILLSACGGSYDGSSGATSAENVGQSARTMDEHFKKNVQPGLNFCRTCHVTDGLADVENGRNFMLSSNDSQDMENLRVSWERLRNSNSTSRILLMSSGQELPHSGGTPWPKDSAQYRNMDIILKCFADPNSCTALLGGAGVVTESFPLLGSARGGHVWDTYCADKPDDALLPVDPRKLVRPGINEGKAVHYNIFWQSCRPESEFTKTCGEHKKYVARGEALITGAGHVGAGSFMAGDDPDSMFAFSSSMYNQLWRRWGLQSRPANFDQLVEERYGSALSSTRNPYPLEGEDPNLTDGGSGQLPLSLTQLRQPDGTWTGKLGLTCSSCHGGKVGLPSEGAGLGPQYGTNSIGDVTLLYAETALPPFYMLAFNKVRGTGNITNFQLFSALEITDPTTLSGMNPLLFVQPSTGTEDPPVWWNVGHRPAKFFDGGQVVDSTRIELSFYYPNAGIVGTDAARQWILDNETASTSWIASTKSPVWPDTIDESLAKQGAVLFHSKDLWAQDLQNPVPAPTGGNGSCASCHGAYSPHYVNDPSYLDTPELEGIAANVVPIDIIGTDPVRLDGNGKAITDSSRKAWFAYRDAPQCGNQNDPLLRGDRELGYLAPPLYGVWASSPYFHNGAVPNLWEVLKPSDRQPIWRRISKPSIPGQESQVMGFETSMASAYDKEKIGWKYESLGCGNSGTMTYVDCSPTGSGPIVEDLFAPLYSNGGLLWNFLSPPMLGKQAIEDRKIYNTYKYSQSNKGHEFTSVLTDPERRALIEYLKTL